MPLSVKIRNQSTASFISSLAEHPLLPANNAEGLRRSWWYLTATPNNDMHLTADTRDFINSESLGAAGDAGREAATSADPD